MSTMRKLTPMLLSTALLLSACATVEPNDVSPGDGPAASTGTAKAKSTKAASKPKVASFKDKYTYPDGVQVEVTKVGKEKLTESAAVDDNSGKPGDPFTVFTIRVRNGSEATLDAVGSGTVSYGPDGEEAPTVFDTGVSGGVEGKILSGKAKSGEFGFLIPKKYQNDVTLEFSADFEHDAAVFTGSVK